MIEWLDLHNGSVIAISTVVLAIVTGFYAWRTHDIAKATKKQAEASVRMAEEMDRQRKNSVMPILGCQLTGTHSVTDTWPPELVKGKLHNAGLGPALDVERGLYLVSNKLCSAKWELMESGATFLHDFGIARGTFDDVTPSANLEHLKFRVEWEDIYQSGYNSELPLTRLGNGLSSGKLMVNLPSS